MSALPALTPLRVIPVSGPRLEPAPLPGDTFSTEEDDDFHQSPLELDPWAVRQGLARRTEVTDLPDPADIIGPLATALIEVLAGRRPVVQLVRWTSAAVYAALTARATVASRRRPAQPDGPVRVSVRRIVVTQPRPGIAEAAIVVIDGTRVRALALQLRGDASGRWIIEALQVG